MGAYLAQAMSSEHDVFASHLKSKPLENLLQKEKWIELDLKEKSSIENVLKKVAPEVLIHAAAISTIKGCEQDNDLASLINVEGTKTLANYCSEMTHFIFLSTDMVFDGRKGNYSEKDELNPLNYYGRTKLLAETAITKARKRSAILRCNLVNGFSPSSSSNFFTDTFARLQQGQPVELFVDEYKSPLFLKDLSGAIKKLIEKQKQGLFHVSGEEKLSRVEFWRLVAQVFGLNEHLFHNRKLAEFPQVGIRPRDTSFNISKIKQALAWAPQSVENNLRAILP